MGQDSGNGRTPAPPADLIVATLLRPRGETGVQTHFQALLRYAGTRNIAARLATPFDLHRMLIVPWFGVGRAGKLVSTSVYVRWHRAGHALLLRRRLRQCIRPAARTVIYAQDPLSARVALELKSEGLPVEVAMIVHFNASQADEWADKGFIRRAGRVYRQILALEDRVIPQVDRLIFPSSFARRELTQRIPLIAPVPAWCIPNFIGRPSGRPRGYHGDLLSIGTLEPRKNHAFLIRVLAEAHRMGHRYRMTIAGAGPLRPRLHALAAGLGVADYLHLPGYVPDAADLLPGFRAYVHGAVLENMPLALIESLAAGRPVFAAPTGGIGEIFDDGVEGRYWNLDDPRDAAVRLVTALEDRAVSERMMAAAQSRYEASFSTENVAPRLLQALMAEPAQAELAG